MNFMTFHSVGNVIIPTYEVIFFRGVGQPPTRYVSHVPSGNLLQFAIEAMAIEIVDLPINNCDFPWVCVCLPEGLFPIKIYQVTASNSPFFNGQIL